MIFPNLVSRTIYLLRWNEEEFGRIRAKKKKSHWHTFLDALPKIFLEFTFLKITFVKISDLSCCCWVLIVLLFWELLFLMEKLYTKYL